jgi:hypothetical protein
VLKAHRLKVLHGSLGEGLNMSRFHLFSAVFAGMMSFSGALIVNPAQAQEGVVMRDILSSIGLVESQKDPIVYRERPPLVVPPKLELTRPMASEEVMANPAWPKDPDVMARQKAADVARIPVTETERYRLEKNPRLTIEEIRSGRRPGAEVKNEPAPRHGDNDLYELYYKPMAQGRAMAAQKRDAKADDLLTYGQEPERRALTDPPKGLRMPASTAAIPKKVEKDYETEKDDVDQLGFATRGY